MSRIFFLILLCACAYGAYRFKDRLPASITTQIGQNLEKSGVVAGISTQFEGNARPIIKNGEKILQSASTLFLSNQSDSAQTPSDSVKSLQTTIESIPSVVGTQAMIMYCTNFLQNATRSATSNN